jgi:hypothetical protein
MSWVVSKKRQTKRIENGEFYIEIQKLSQGDKDDRMDLLASMNISEKSKDQLANMNLGKMKQFERSRSIIGWNLKYDDGTPVPLTEEAIKNLPEEIINAIDEGIEELNPEQLPEAKKKK